MHFVDLGFSAAITALEKGCQWEMALNILRRMPEAACVVGLQAVHIFFSDTDKDA